MRFRDIYASSTEPVLSIEVYPPKTEKAQKDLRNVIPRLVALGPRFMTVTYGALGSTRDTTIEIAATLRRDFHVETASHLTCVGSTREDLDGILDRLHDAGIENIVALRGDPPRGESAFVPPPGGFSHGNELVSHIRSGERFGIAVAGYPEKHVEAPDIESDRRRLADKVVAGADLVITQLFFDNASYFEFARALRALGVTVPLVPGILPIQSLAQIEKMTGLCGAQVPPALRSRLAAAGGDPAREEDAGLLWTEEQCRELLERGVPGLHFYVLNRAGAMERILGRLRDQGTLGPPVRSTAEAALRV
jgi:methylenetetrahydrofolate reductase (NADPH)